MYLYFTFTTVYLYLLRRIPVVSNSLAFPQQCIVNRLLKGTSPESEGYISHGDTGSLQLGILRKISKPLQDFCLWETRVRTDTNMFDFSQSKLHPGAAPPFHLVYTKSAGITSRKIAGSGP
jgi:hypothetical protein